MRLARDRQSLTLLDDWAVSPFDQPELARVLVHAPREALVAMTAEGVADNTVRSQARTLLERTFDALLARFEELYRQPRADVTTAFLWRAFYFPGASTRLPRLDLGCGFQA